MINNTSISVNFTHTCSPFDHTNSIAIIGNGIAGLTAAIEARTLAPDKHVVIITDQQYPTIYTPALKQFAAGKLSQSHLFAYPEDKEQAEQITLLHAHVEYIHAQNKYIRLQDKRYLGYESLLLATGSIARTLPPQLPGHDFTGVFTLHRLPDYVELKQYLPQVQTAVVIGGGVHAIDTITVLLNRGVRVHWLIREDIVLSHIVDAVGSTMILNTMQRAGAIVHLATEVREITGQNRTVNGIVTNHGDMIPCQLVIACIGTQAATNLAHKSTIPLQHQHGLLVDSTLRTSVHDIYAAGDVAAFLNPQSGHYETHATWYDAVTQGRAAGAMMVGQQQPVQQPFGVHWHATHLGELSMLTAGTPLRQDQHTTTLTDISQGGYRRVTLQDDRLIGYLSLGELPADSLAIKRIIDEGKPVHTILKQLLKGHLNADAYFSQQQQSTVPHPAHHHTLFPTSQHAPMTQPSTQPSPAHQMQPVAIQAPTPAPDPITDPLLISTTKQQTTARLQPFSRVNKNRHHRRIPSLLRLLKPNPIILHKTAPQVRQEIQACIGCNECLLACPALAEPITIDVLNRETIDGPISEPVARFTRACYQCGACVAPCPVGLHRDAMMMWLKVRMLKQS
ncbi:MAG TPA: FAD-dependent oxidoreductase [Dictyobacter sp.]|nr:FAD-dependent oxidoreductase [Dictyobacter sp.]